MKKSVLILLLCLLLCLPLVMSGCIKMVSATTSGTAAVTVESTSEATTTAPPETTAAPTTVAPTTPPTTDGNVVTGVFTGTSFEGDYLHAYITGDDFVSYDLFVLKKIVPDVETIANGQRVKATWVVTVLGPGMPGEGSSVNELKKIELIS